MSAAEEGESCGICFNSIHPQYNARGTLNSCQHVFCFYCIKKWAECTNVCPHCKARFTTVTLTDANGKVEVKKIRKRNYKLWDQGDSDDEEGGGVPTSRRPVVLCSVCGEGNNAVRMILCDQPNCNYAVHLDCAGLSERPPDFFCSECRTIRGEPPLSTPPLRESNEGPTSNAAESTAVSSSPQFVGIRPATPPAISTAKKMRLVPPAFLHEAMERYNRKGHKSDREEGSDAQSVQTHRDANEWTAQGGYITDDSSIRNASRAAMQQYLQRVEQRKDRETYRRSQRDAQRQQRGYLAHGTRRMCTRQRVNVAVSGMGEAEALLDPVVRRREEERLAKQLASEMMPTLRRNQAIQDSRLTLDGDGRVVVRPPMTELEAEGRGAELYSRALIEGRRIAQERISARVTSLRFWKEEMLVIQAEREATALNRLATMIASRRSGREPSRN